jgi:acyl-CoA thioester hydrolase
VNNPVNHESGPTAWVETRQRVRYAETDQMGVVYYANYLVWIEVGRVEYFRAQGFSYRQLEQEDNCRLPVVEARCRYKAPARYDDRIVIRARISSRRGAVLRFEYEITREDDAQVLATGETVHVFVDENFEACEPPERVRQAITSQE